MKIAIVSQPFDGVLPPYQNSIGIWTYEVSQRLAAAHEVTVYLKDGPPAAETDGHQNLRFRRISLRPDRLLQKFTSRLLPAPDARRPEYAAGHRYFGYALQVARDLRRRACDLVHVMNFSQFVPVLRTFNPRVKIALNMRCEWLSQLDRRLIGRRLAKTDLVLGCSNHITGKVRERFPEFAERCQTVFNGVDLETFARLSRQREKTADGPPRLLFVGRVSPEKGVHVLLAAMPAVVRQVPEVQLEIVGGHSQLPWDYLGAVSDDPKVQALAEFYAGSSRTVYVGHLQDQVQALGLADNVTFTGSLPYAEVVDRYRGADLVINPSFSESFGRSLVEAMSCGLPVVATRVGGMLDSVADGETGLLCEAGDAGGLAAAILRLLAKPDQRRQMGAAGRLRASALFSWDSVVRQLVSAYRQELAGHG